MKELAKEVEGEFNCLGKNTEKYKSFSVAITKEVKRVGKDGEEIAKTIFYKQQLLKRKSYGKLIIKSNFVDNLAKRIHKIRRKYGYDNKKCEIWGIKHKYYECCPEYANFKMV